MSGSVRSSRQLLDILREESLGDPNIGSPLARVMPVLQGFDFQTPAEFEDKARQAVCAWLPTLAGKRFFLRMHRRGFKVRLSSMEEERFLDTYLLEALEMAGSKGRISFDDPDAIISLGTLGSSAGLSLWSREDLERYPLFPSALNKRPVHPFASTCLILSLSLRISSGFWM